MPPVSAYRPWQLHLVARPPWRDESGCARRPHRGDEKVLFGRYARVGSRHRQVYSPILAAKVWWLGGSPASRLPPWAAGRWVVVLPWPWWRPIGGRRGAGYGAQSQVDRSLRRSHGNKG